MRPTLEHHPGHGRGDGGEAKPPTPALPHVPSVGSPPAHTTQTQGWSRTAGSKMIYFLSRAGSYRVWQHIGQGRLQGAPSGTSLCVCVHLAHMLTPTRAQSLHTGVHAHSCMQQHTCTSCFKPLCHTGGHGRTWGGQQAGPPQASPAKPRAPRPCMTPPADHVGRASPVSCPQTLFSAGRSVPDAIWLQRERMEAPVSGSGTHSIVTWSRKPAPTSSPHPSLGTASPHVPRHHQPAAGSPVPEAPSHPLPSCSTWQARGAHGSAGEGMGIWGCSFANSHCKPWQDSLCLSCSAGFHYCLAPAILLACPRHRVPASVQVNVLILQVVRVLQLDAGYQVVIVG